MSLRASPKKSVADVVSLYGSVSGGTFVSRRSRRLESKLNPAGIDQLAKDLREFDFDEGACEKEAGAELGARRFNTSFHHFRFIVVMFAGVSVGLMMLLRYGMTISILKMVNQTHLFLQENPNKTVDDFLEQGYSLGGEFNWDNEVSRRIIDFPPPALLLLPPLPS